MTADEFAKWRQRMGVTQERVAEMFKVTRTTVQNWESGGSPVPQAVDVGSEVWEHRLKQENPNLGPVTLIYSNGSMFISPYGPRRAPAMMQQEPYPTTTGALARVQQLWGREDFCNPFIIDESRDTVWNIVELERVVAGKDDNAPSLTNLLRSMARDIRANSHRVAGNGRNMLTPAELESRKHSIESLAGELDNLADAGLATIVRERRKIEAVIAELHRLGTRAPDGLLSAIAQALVVFERGPTPAEEPRLEGQQYILNYRGGVIIWPKLRTDTARWIVNVASENPGLLTRLGGCQVIEDPYSLDNAIQKARRLIDDSL